MDPKKVCCALGLCCPPGSQEQMDTLVSLFVSAGLSDVDARTSASVVVDLTKSAKERKP